jgi:hypothetical protein
MALMSAAAREFGVPVRLLLAISYDQTRWLRTGDSPGIDCGFGLMNLTARTIPAPDGCGLPSSPVTRAVALASTHYALDGAAQLLHQPTTVLQASERQNVRGAAALLAHYAQLSGGATPRAGRRAWSPRVGSRPACASATSSFTTPIRSSDGAVTEKVPPADVSWGAGDWYVNMHAINIETRASPPRAGPGTPRPSTRPCMG